MRNQKYEIIEDMVKEIVEKGKKRTVYRIRALRDIPKHNVFAGEYGGWIEHKSNLSQEGECWVQDDACVADDSKVADDALVSGSARVYGKSVVDKESSVRVEAFVYDSRISDMAQVIGNAVVITSLVNERSIIRGNAQLKDAKVVMSNSIISGHAFIEDSSIHLMDSKIQGDTVILQSRLGTFSSTARNVEIYGKAYLSKVYFRSPVAILTICDMAKLDTVTLSAQETAISGVCKLSGDISLQRVTVQDVVSIQLVRKSFQLSDDLLFGDVRITDNDIIN